MELYVVSIFKVNKNIPCLETGLELKLSSLLSYVLKKKKSVHVRSYFTDACAWKAWDTNPLKKCKWRKVIFYEGYFVVFSIGKVGFQSISECQKHHCLFLVYTAFSKSFCDCYVMVFKVKFHRAFGIGRKRNQCYVSHNVSSGSRVLDLGLVAS